MNYIIHLSIITVLLSTELQSAQLLKTGHQFVPSLGNRYLQTFLLKYLEAYFKI